MFDPLLWPLITLYSFYKFHSKVSLTFTIILILGALNNIFPTCVMLLIRCFFLCLQVIVNVIPENRHTPYFALDVYEVPDVSEDVTTSEEIVSGMCLSKYHR